MNEKIWSNKKLILGIDPGTTAACCLMDRDTEDVYALVTLKNPTMIDVMNTIAELLPVKSDCYWFVEQQFGKMWKGKMIVDSLTTQVVNRAKWSNAAELLDYNCEVVFPNTWRAVTFVGMGKHDSKEWKKIAIAFAKDKVKEKFKINEHCAEAMGIALYGVRKMRQAKAAKKRKK